MFQKSFRLAAGAVLLAALALPPAHAGEIPAPASGGPLGATVQELLAWADQHNPELAAARLEAAAAVARIQPAGALDDPLLRMELQGIDRDNPNLLPSRVGSTKYTLAQTFPWWGKRDLKREAAAADAAQAGARGAATQSEVHAQIKNAFAMYYQIRQTTLLTNEILQLARNLERIAEARYANGLAPQQDVIKAQVEQTTLRAELINLEKERHHARTRFNIALNRPSYASLVEPRELRPLPLLDAPILEERILAESPLLSIQAAQVDGAEKSRLVTEKNRYPDVTLGISPVQRGNRLDNWEAMVEINLPLQQESRRARESEAAALLAAAQARRQAATNQVVAWFREALEALTMARSQANLVKNTLLPQAEASFQSALAGYQAGRVDFATLLEAQRQIRKARLEHLNLRVEQELRLSEIERLLGKEL